MARWLAVCGVVLAIGWAVGWTTAAPAAAEPLDPAAYTEAVARAMSAARVLGEVTVAGPLMVRVRGPGDHETMFSLRNLYSDYRRDPSLFDVIVDVYIRTMTERPPEVAGAAIDRTRIVPMIKDRTWLSDTRRDLAVDGGTLDLVHEAFVGDLIVVYAQDSAGRIRYLTTEDRLDIDRKDLRSLAVDNLARLLPKVEVRMNEAGFGLVVAGGDYEASLLLFHDMWTNGQIKVDGDIVVAVPAKDVLLVTGSKSRKGLQAVRKLIPEFMAQDRYRVSDALLVYRKGRFVRFGRPAATPAAVPDRAEPASPR